METIKQACFGGVGSGKTLQIASLIKAYGAGNVGIVSCEHGLHTIQSSLVGVQKREPKNMLEFKEAWKWAQDTFSGDKWVCVDGGTRVIQWMRDDIMQGTDAAYIKLATGEATRNTLDKAVKSYLRYITSDGNIDTRKQWMSLAYDVDFEMSRWVGLECNHYWTFWEDETWIGDQRKGPPYVLDAPGKGSRDAVYGAFDFILRLTREGEAAKATHDPTGRVVKSKARDDWDGGIKVPAEQPNFRLATFVEEVLRRKETR